MSVVVGIDLGSGAARAVALARDGGLVGSVSVPYAGRTEWEAGHAVPAAWQNAVEGALEALVAQDRAVAAPAALAVGGQSPAVVSSDGSAALTVMHPAATDAGDPQVAHERLLEVLDLPPTAEPMQAWDWILHMMGAPVQQGRWPDTPALSGFGPVSGTGTVVGEASGAWGVAPGTPLVPGGPDAFLAFWAAAVERPGRGLDPGGRTGGLGVGSVAAEDSPSGYALRSAVAGVDIVGGPVTAHGLSLEWWSRLTSQPVEVLLASAESVPPGAGGVLALPYLIGERAPRWNRDLRAELVGMDAETTAGQVMRALLEGCAFGLRHISDVLAEDGVALAELVVAGSPALSRLWSQIKADVLGVPVEVPEYTELAAYGAALAAGAASGWWPRPREGRAGDWPRPGHTALEPKPRAVYEDAYHRWRALGDAAEARLLDARTP